MRVRAKPILTFVCLIVLGQTSYASNSVITTSADLAEGLYDKLDDARVKRALIVELLEWIEDRTNYDISTALAEPPKIDFCKAVEETRYEGRTVVLDQQIAAFYDSLERRICIFGPWSSTSVSNVSTLLHELIHDMQYLSKTWSCWGETEWEAYKLQEQWLIEQGENPDFEWVDILLRTRCRRDIHP
ncbi:MAG: DUF6647 family protein [Gammaproteobacteria bacterium]